MPSKTFSVEFETSGFAKASSQMSSVSSDAEDAGDSIDEAGDSAEDAGDKMDETGDKASAMGAKISNAGKVGAAGIAAITTAVTGAIAGIGTLVYKTAQYARQVDRAAEQSGVSAEKIQEVAFAAQQVAGADFESVRDGFKELALRSQEAAMGTGEAKEAFDRLGISQEFLRKNSTAEIFSRVRQELQGASSKMRIMAAEMLFGGEAGEKLVEVLGLSNKEMQRFSKQAQKTGSVLSSKQVAALERTRGAWRGLTSEIQGLGRQIGAMFAPLVTQEIIPGLRSMAQSVRAAVESLSNMSATTKGTIALVSGLTAAVSAGLTIWGSWPAIIAGVSAAFSGLATAATTAWAAITSPITGVIAAVAALAGIAGLVYDNWSGLSSFFSSLFSSIGSAAKAFGRELVARFGLAWAQVKKLFAQGINALIDTVNSGLEKLGAQSYTIEGEVGISSSAIAANRSRLQDAQRDFAKAARNANSTLKGSFSSGWAAVKQSTSDAVGFVQNQIANLGSMFSLPSIGSSQGGGSQGQSGRSGDSQSSGAGNIPKWLTQMNDFVRLVPQAKDKTTQLEAAGKSATRAIASGFQSVTSQVGAAVSNLLRGKDAALNFGRTLVNALGQVIQKLVQVAAKLAIVASIKAIANISSGGITSIGGALGAALFADGGVVTGPTLSVIGEGSETEAVLPLSRLESMLSVPAMQAQAQAPEAGGSQGLVVQVEVDGERKTAGRDIVTSYNATTRAQARRGR